MAENKLKKSSKRKNSAQAEKEFGSFELVSESITFYLKNFSVYLPFAAAIGALTVLISLFLPEKETAAKNIFTVYMTADFIKLILLYPVLVLMARMLDKNNSGSQPLEMGKVFRDSLCSLLRYWWTRICYVFLFLTSPVVLVILGISSRAWKNILFSILFLTGSAALAGVGAANKINGLATIGASLLLAPGLYSLFAVFFAPAVSIIGGESAKKPVKTSWHMTRNNMLNMFFALMAYFLIFAGATIAFALAAWLLLFMVKLIFGLYSEKSNLVLFALYFSLLAPVWPIYGYHLYKKMAASTGIKTK